MSASRIRLALPPRRWDKTGIVTAIRPVLDKLSGSGQATLGNRKFQRKFAPPPQTTTNRSASISHQTRHGSHIMGLTSKLWAQRPLTIRGPLTICKHLMLIYLITVAHIAILDNITFYISGCKWVCGLYLVTHASRPILFLAFPSTGSILLTLSFSFDTLDTVFLDMSIPFAVVTLDLYPWTFYSKSLLAHRLSQSLTSLFVFFRNVATFRWPFPS